MKYFPRIPLYSCFNIKCYWSFVLMNINVDDLIFKGGSIKRTLEINK